MRLTPGAEDFVTGISHSKLARLLLTAAVLAIAPLIQLSAQQAPLSGSVVLPQKSVVAGVTVFTHDRSAFTRAAMLVAAPAALSVMGGANGDPAYDLTKVQEVALLTGGGIAAFSADQRLLVFNPDGTPRRTIGRRGQGPGEFAGNPRLLALAGDTLLVTEFVNVRMSWIVVDKGVIRIEPLRNRLPPLVEKPVGMLPGGRVVFTSAGMFNEPQHPPSGFSRTKASVAVLPARGPAMVVATIADVQLKTVPTNFRGSPGVMADYVRYGLLAHIVVWDTLIATTTGDTYTIDLRDNRGHVVSRIQVATPRRVVTSSMRTARIAAEVEELHQGPADATRDPVEAERLFRTAPFADSLPATTDLFVTPNRTLWVLDKIMPSDPGWTATGFRLDGAIIGRLRGPGGTTPVAFGNDRVVLRSTDADSVVKLEVHRIVAAGRH